MCCVIATLLLAVDSNIVEPKTHLPLATGLRDNREDAQLAEQLAEALRNPLVHYIETLRPLLAPQMDWLSD